MAKNSWIADKIEKWDTSRLKGYKNNPRTHSGEQVEQIAASITEFGFTNPILAGSDGVIVAGHGRLAAAHRLGLKEVPVVVLDHLTPTQRQALIIADNRIAENAGWDLAMLATELDLINTDGFDLSLTGFSDEEAAAIIDPAETVAEKTERIRPIDYTRILISIPIGVEIGDDFDGIMRRIVQLGGEVDYGGNNKDKKDGQ